MKDEKMLSIRIPTVDFTEFKELCAENNKSMKGVISDFLRLLIKAKKSEGGNI